MVSPTSCGVCRKITLRLPPQVDLVRNRRHEVRRATESLVRKPCVRIEKRIKNRIKPRGRDFTVHPNLILFDVALLEMKAEDATLKCNLRSIFRPLNAIHDLSTASYLGAHTVGGTWQFGFATIPTPRNGNNPAIYFHRVGFQKKEFLAIADQRGVCFTFGFEKTPTLHSKCGRCRSSWEVL